MCPPFRESFHDGQPEITRYAKSSSETIRRLQLVEIEGRKTGQKLNRWKIIE